MALGGTDPAMLSSLASRLSRLDKQCEPEDRQRIEAASGGPSLENLVRRIVEGLDPDVQAGKAGRVAGLAADQQPTEAQVRDARAALLKEAARPLAENPAFRTLLQELKKKYEQVIDEVSQDDLLLDHPAATAAEQLARMSSLRQSILKWAFEGKLGDQDPKDEPAFRAAGTDSR